MDRRRSGLLHPFFICLTRFGHVHRDVAVTIASFGLANANRLMPAVHAGDRIGLNGEGQVLMDAGVGPPDSLRVGIARREWLHAALTPQLPAGSAAIELHRRHPLALTVVRRFPASHVMAAGHYARTNAFGHPRLDHEMPDPSLHPHQLTVPHADS